MAILSPFTQIQQHGTSAVIASEGHGDQAIWFQQIGGRWKQQLDPPIGKPLDEAAEDRESDVAAIEKITGEIEQGKYKTEKELRDALGAAMLNSFSDPTCTLDFQPNDYQPGRPEPVQHQTPTTLGSGSADPATPAGAMSRFVRAVVAGDEKIAAGSFDLKNDVDGSAAAAIAHDYVVGVRFLHAAQAKKTADTGWHVVAYPGVLQPQSLRDYTADEWKIVPGEPDLAISSGSYVGKPEIYEGKPAYEMQHTWTPMMHRGPDSVWRIGPHYPQSERQLADIAKRLAAKDKVLENAIADLANGKLSSETLFQSVGPQFKQLGVRPVATEAR